MIKFNMRDGTVQTTCVRCKRRHTWLASAFLRASMRERMLCAKCLKKDISNKTKEGIV